MDDRPTGKAGIVAQRGHSILIVDGLSETADVLKAVFEPRGHSVRRVRQTQLDVSPPLRPSVVVWHANESGDGLSPPRFASVPQIVIGKTRVPQSSRTTRQFSQPFDYAELLQAIESVLQTSAT